MRLRLRAWIVVWLWAVPLAHAESPADPPPLKADPDTVTPLRATVRARKTPTSATVTDVGSDVLRAAPRRSATDLLRLAPGVVAAQHGGDGKAHQLFVRGFDAVHGQDVEVEVGGLRINEVSHVHALGYADTNFVIPEAVRGMRLQEGASRAEQGDFAVAGTLSFELGLDAPGLLARLEAGTFDQQRLVLGFRPEGDDRSFVTLQATRGAGFGPRRGFSRVSGLSQFGVASGAFDLRLLAGASIARFQAAGVVRESEVRSGVRDLFEATDPWQGGSSSRLFALAEGRWKTEEQASTLTLSLQRTGFVNKQDYTGFLRDPVHGDGLVQAQDAVQARLEARQVRKLDLLDRPLKLEGGLGARVDTLDHRQVPYDLATGGLRDEVRLRDWHVDQLDAFGWLEGEWKLERLQIRLDARLDTLVSHAISAGPGEPRDALASGPNLGLKGGLVVPLPSEWKLSLDYGEGFRSPYAPALVDKQRTPFTRIRTLDLGTRNDGEAHSIGASAFGSLVDDDVFFDHLVARTTYVGSTARGGVGLRGHVRAFDSFVLQAHGTAAYAALVTDGTRLPGFASLVGRLDLGWHRDVSLSTETAVIHLGSGVTGVGPRPLRDGTWGEGYVLVDARVALRWRQLELAVDATNLLDARWFDGTFSFPSHFDPTQPVSALPARHVTAGAPRQLFVSITYQPEGDRP